ncbi:protein EIN4-like isoform X2 [Diospyros lotus]|uniref:protein EIN4-like isoform X2 n=1 Tax=Diospyros lotus TaxID=55363 RepID=UPI00224CEC4B|nr:protein EIN4-like isoform X2 [Diospyros lotus]
MVKPFAFLWLVPFLLVCVSAIDNGFTHCHCDDEGLWSVNNILECQKVSDFLIAVAYFSIPLELLYFVSCSNVPFKLVLVQFIAFIVLCGLTHLLNGWTYYGPHSFQLMLALTVAKILTALVSCATAITLLTLIPLLLKVKVRELFLRQNVLELDQEVGMMKKQKEASWHVRMLTQEIRKSLNKLTILHTTLVELSNTLDLQNCAVWMPNEKRTEMHLTHQLKRSSSTSYGQFLPINDPDVLDITNNKGVRILRPDSSLGSASSGGSSEFGAVAAIRMPMLCVLNFKGGTPEFVETPYAILVLVLPNGNGGDWSYNEMEIVEVVADQVAVALSHAAVLEESQLMREKLEEQNRMLQQAKQNAMMASQARNTFQKVMSHGMRRPMHSILGLLSMFQDDSLNSEQRIVVDTMVKTGSVLSTLINDVMDISPKDVQSSLPNQVISDEKRVFQILLHMVGHLLNISGQGGSLTFRVVSDGGNNGRKDKTWGIWRPTANEEYVTIKFEIEVGDGSSQSSDSSITTIHFAGRRHNTNNFKEGLSFSMCRKLVQMMQGNIWVSSNFQGHTQSMTLVLRLPIQPSQRAIFEQGNLLEQPKSNSMFRGLKVILADDDDVNRTVTKKLLEKLGCRVSAVSSGFECLSALGPTGNSFQVVVLDLQMPEMDGFEVAIRIRKFRSHNWPLIIALTASAEENVWERCLQTGMNGVIRKPVLLQGMADELRRVLQQANDGVVK